VRAATYSGAETSAVAGVDPALANLGILAALAVVAFALGARSIPRTD